MARRNATTGLAAVFVITAALAGMSARGVASPNYLVIAVDRSEDVYVNNESIASAAALTTSINSSKPTILYIRADSDVRAEAVSRVLESARGAGLKAVMFGNPPGVKRVVPVHLVTLTDPVELMAKTLRPGDGYAVLIDFDGTLYHAGSVIGATALDDAFEMAAARTPNLPVIACYNRLSKFGAVSAVLGSAQQHGLKHTVLAVDPSTGNCQ